MKRRVRSAAIWGLWGICAAVIALVFATGALGKQKVWPDVQLNYTGGKQGVWRLEDGDAHGRVASGPYDDLPVGVYRIKWQIEGDGENRIVLSCSNDAQITPTEIAIHPDAWEGEAWFEIKEPTHSFSINLDFLSGTWMQVYNIRLYSPFYADRAFTLAAALIALCLLLTLHARGWLTAQGLRAGLVLAAAVVFASLPCLGENMPMAYDTHFHAARIMNLADGLRAGQLPVRVGGFSYNGYGAMTSVFYPDLLLYPWALMVLGGASMTYVLATLVIAVNAISAACMVMCARRLLRDQQAALCAGLLYVFSLYRLEDIYRRMMVGEMLAMAFLPLFLLGLYEVVLGEKRRWPLLAFGATLIFRSHMLSTVLCAGAALVVGLCFLRRIVRERRLAAIAKACALTLLMNLNQLVPLIDCYRAGVSTTVWQFGFADAALDLPQLLCYGMLPSIGLLAFACADVPRQDRPARRTLWLLCAAGLLSALLATKLIPWSHISRLSGGLVDVLQFPWRFLLLASVCCALCCGDGIARLAGGRGTQAALVILVVAVLGIVPQTAEMSAYEEQLEFGQGAKTYMIYPEYQIEGTDVNRTRSRQPVLLGDVTLTQYEKDGTRVTAQVTARTDAQVTLPMFGFPGYAAALDGERIPWICGGGNNCLTIPLPAGAQGELRVWYEGKTNWKVLDGLSAVSALGLAAHVFIGRKRKRA